MAGELRRVGCGLMVAGTVWATDGFAQNVPPTPSVSPTPAARELDQRPNRTFRKDANSAEFENVRKAIEALTPEQRTRFAENFRRWVNLSPEEKKSLREREEVRRKLMKEEFERAIGESGLQLEGERRAQFAIRYGEERRKIEEQLRSEVSEKRKPLVKEMLTRLREEFSTPPSTPIPATLAP